MNDDAMKTELIMQFLRNPNPAMMDQFATKLAENPEMTPPPPGSMQQARAMLAQQGVGGLQFGPQGGPQGPDLGSILNGGAPPDLMNPPPGNYQQGTLAGPTGAP